MKLKFKFHQIHLVAHEFIGEMRIHSTDQSFRTIPHPRIHDIGANVLRASRCKGMTQEILRNFLVLQNLLKNTIQGVQRAGTFNRFGDIDILSNLLRNRDLLIYLIIYIQYPPQRYLEIKRL